MNTQNQNGYMLLFRGTDQGLSPEELQKVTDNWMAWFKRLTDEGKAIAGNPWSAKAKSCRGKTVSCPTVHSRNPKKQLAAIFFSTSPRWTKRLPSPGIALVCRMAFASKSDPWRANVRLRANLNMRRSSRTHNATHTENSHGSLR